MATDQQYIVRQGPPPPLGPMSKGEAEFAVKQIRRSLGDVRRQAVEFDERKGWAVLTNPATGKLFGSMRECIEPLFGISRSRFYQQLNAARVQENLSTNVDNCNADDIPESVLRPLAGKPPEVQRQAFAEASANGAPTAEKVRQAVERIEEPPQTTATMQTPIPSGSVPRMPPPGQETRTMTTPAVTQSEPEPKRPTPTIDALLSPDEEWTVGLIDRVVFTRAGLTLADLVDAGRRILAAAEQGGATWEMRLKIATRPNPK